MVPPICVNFELTNATNTGGTEPETYVSQLKNCSIGQSTVNTNIHRELLWIFFYLLNSNNKNLII